METIQHFKSTPKAEMETVCVINRSTKVFKDAWNGIGYTLRPRTKVYVPRHVAKHWLGDPDKLGDTEELERIRLRLGEFFELLVSGELSCQQFGDQTAAYQRSRATRVLAVQEGIPLDDEEGIPIENLATPVDTLASVLADAGVVPADLAKEAAAFVAGESPAR